MDLISSFCEFFLVSRLFYIICPSVDLEWRESSHNTTLKWWRKGVNNSHFLQRNFDDKSWFAVFFSRIKQVKFFNSNKLPIWMIISIYLDHNFKTRMWKYNPNSTFLIIILKKKILDKIISSERCERESRTTNSAKIDQKNTSSDQKNTHDSKAIRLL